MENVDINNINIGDKVIWSYGSIKETLYIRTKPLKSKRIGISRKNRLGKLIEGGYVRVDELYKL